MKKIINFIDKEDRKAILNFIAYVSFFGIAANFSLYAIFLIKFNYFSWIGFGLFIWLLEKKIVPILRNIFIR